MAKYYRRRRFYRRRGTRWSPNLTRIRGDGTAPANSPFADSITIAQNNTATSNNSISQAFTVKNIEVSAQLEADSTGGNNVENIEYYIMFVPQGYAISANLPEDHPEWIMNYKYIGSAFSYSSLSDSNAQVPRIKTRLSRKLQTGDSVIFLIRGVNRNSTDVGVLWNGLVRWWTKAN